MKKIFIVDDDDIERTALKEILKAEPDWQVTEASDGQQALDLLCDGLRPTSACSICACPRSAAWNCSSAFAAIRP